MPAEGQLGFRQMYKLFTYISLFLFLDLHAHIIRLQLRVHFESFKVLSHWSFKKENNDSLLSARESDVVQDWVSGGIGMQKALFAASDGRRPIIRLRDPAPSRTSSRNLRTEFSPSCPRRVAG